MTFTQRGKIDDTLYTYMSKVTLNYDFGFNRLKVLVTAFTDLSSVFTKTNMQAHLDRL